MERKQRAKRERPGAAVHRDEYSAMTFFPAMMREVLVLASNYQDAAGETFRIASASEIQNLP